MNSSGRTLALIQTCVRYFGQTAVRNSSSAEAMTSKYPVLKEGQKHFGIPDHTPIYIKGGVTDKLIYGTTAILTTIGLGMSGEVLFKLAYK